jgi:hypothetical protein
LDVVAIHEALAGQIRSNVARTATVRPFPQVGVSGVPVIFVVPDTGEYLTNYTTFGANGQAEMHVKIWVQATAADDESIYRIIAEYLSIGTGNQSSIADAVGLDRTLGGVVEDCYLGAARMFSLPPDGPVTGEIDVLILIRKQGAQL